MEPEDCIQLNNILAYIDSIYELGGKYKISSYSIESGITTVETKSKQTEDGWIDFKKLIIVPSDRVMISGEPID